MRRRCTIALVLAVVLAVATFSGRRSNFARTETESAILDEFAVPLLEDICHGRDAGTTGTPLISLISVCPRWPFCPDEKVLLYTLHQGKVIFYWYRKVQPCSLQYHASGPCENGESKGFEVLARAIESGKAGLQVKDKRLVWEGKFVYAFSLEALSMKRLAFTGRIYFQREAHGNKYYSQPVSASLNGFSTIGSEKREEYIIPGASLSSRTSVPPVVWALGLGAAVYIFKQAKVV
jgi:hypothetical protein